MVYSVRKNTLNSPAHFERDIAPQKTPGRYHFYDVNKEIRPFVEQLQQLVLDLIKSGRNRLLTALREKHRERLLLLGLCPGRALDLAVVDAIWEDTRNKVAGTNEVKKLTRAKCDTDKLPFCTTRMPYTSGIKFFSCALHCASIECTLQLEKIWELSRSKIGMDKHCWSLLLDALKGGHKELRKAAGRLENRTLSQSAQRNKTTSVRLPGKGLDAWLLSEAWFNALLTAADESASFWLTLHAWKARAYLIRVMLTYQSRYTLPKEKIEVLIELGRKILRLSSRLGLPITYNLHYFCIGNPQPMKASHEELMVSEDECLGFQAVASAKGGESKHADTKRRALSDTNGHDDWPAQLVTALSYVVLSQTDGNLRMDDLQFKAEDKVRFSDDEPKEGMCACGAPLGDDDHHLHGNDGDDDSTSEQGECEEFLRQHFFFGPISCRACRAVRMFLIDVCQKSEESFENSRAKEIMKRETTAATIDAGRGNFDIEEEITRQEECVKRTRK